MTLNKIASQIAKLEGKKSQARIGDIREILKIIVKNEVEVSKGKLEAPSMLEVMNEIAASKIK